MLPPHPWRAIDWKSDSRPRWKMLNAMLGSAVAMPDGASMEAACSTVLAHPGVVQALDDIKADDMRTLAEQKTLAEIPAPPFKESARAAYYLDRLREVGVDEAAIDAE